MPTAVAIVGAACIAASPSRKPGATYARDYERTYPIISGDKTPGIRIADAYPHLTNIDGNAMMPRCAGYVYLLYRITASISLTSLSKRNQHIFDAAPSTFVSA